MGKGPQIMVLLPSPLPFFSFYLIERRPFLSSHTRTIFYCYSRANSKRTKKKRRENRIELGDWKKKM